MNNDQIYSVEDIFHIMLTWCKENYNYKIVDVPEKVYSFCVEQSKYISTFLLDKYNQIERDATLYTTNIQIACFLVGVYLFDCWNKASLSVDDLSVILDGFDFAKQQKVFDFLEEKFIERYGVILKKETPHSLHIKILNTIYSYTIEYRIWDCAPDIKREQEENLSTASILNGFLYAYNAAQKEEL